MHNIWQTVGLILFLPPVGGHEYIIYIFSCFLLPSVCRYQEVERPGNWDSGPGVVDVSVISTTALALSPDRVDCQCPCKVSRVHNRGKVLLPWVTGSLFLPYSILLPSGSGSPKCLLLLSGVVRLSVPWDLGSLFVCVREWGGDKQKDRDTICVCEGEWRRLFGGLFEWFQQSFYWMGSHRLLCLYTKKLFCFERNNWAFHRKPESTDKFAAALKDTHTHTHTHTHSFILMPKPVSVTT